MSAAPNHERQRLLDANPLAELVRESGVELRRHGATDLVGLCPFHEEKTPSLVVSPARGLFHCLGCGEAGSSFDWVMKTRGVGFKQARALLRARSGGNGRVLKRTTVPTQPPPAVLDADDQAQLDAVAALYHRSFRDCPEPQAYMRGRGLELPELYEHFRIGFSDRSLGSRIPQRSRKAGAEIRASYQRIGLLRSTGHEHFAGSVVLPIFDEHGHVTEMYGRKITANVRRGTPLHLYLPGPHKGVWNIEAVQACEEIILCEAPFDALTFWRWGFRNVTFAYGIEGLTEEIVAAFVRHGVQRVLIAYDRDPAGDRGTEKASRKLSPQGIGCFRIEFPHGMDANEYALKVTPADRALALLIRGAKWLGKGPAPAITSAPEPPVVLGSLRSQSGDGSRESGERELEMAKPGSSLAVEPSPASEADAIDSAPVSSPATAPEGPAPTPAPAPAPASPLALVPRVDLPTEIREHEIFVAIGDRCYRVRGLEKNLSRDRLHVSLRAMRAVDPVISHQDNLDFCDAAKRARFIKAAAAELAAEERTIKRDLGKLHMKLEELQDEQIQAALEPRQKEIVLTPAEHDRAMELLRAPDLLEQVKESFRRCGIVGETTNLIVAFLAAVSRLLEKPLGILVQSSSAAGKSMLLEAVLAFMPDEAKVKYSAMTAQSLFYMGGTDLRHKVVLIAEQEGAAGATYPLKLLISEGELSIASTGKDPQTGRLTTHEYRVEGPVALLTSTTAVDLDEELQNRCITLGIDESREQTRRIHRQQRFERTVEGIWQRQERKEIRERMQNAQRLLKPHVIFNPFVEDLSFVDKQTRTRRDHPKYLALIDAIALLYQHQRPRHVIERDGKRLECVVVTKEDVQLANELASEVLGRSLGELSPQTRNLLLQVHEMVSEATERLKIDRPDYRFSRKDVRDYTGWSDFQVRMHMEKLVRLEYVLVHRGKRGQSFVYELVYNGEGQGGERFLMRLLDPEQLSDRDHACRSLGEGRFDGKFEHPKPKFEHGNGKFEGPSSIQRAPNEHPSSISQNGSEPLQDRARNDFEPESRENAHIGAASGAPSNLQIRRSGGSLRSQSDSALAALPTNGCGQRTTPVLSSVEGGNGQRLLLGRTHGEVERTWAVIDCMAGYSDEVH